MNLGREALGRLFNWAGVQAAGGFWMPEQGSTTAVAVDHIFSLVLWVSVFFFVLIVTLMVVFVVRYRRRPGRLEAEPSPTHNTPLEITWTVIPIAITIVIFIWGFKVYLDVNTPPANAYEVMVTGQKWKWLFTYPNGHVDENLHVPVDTPIRLVMTSEDVIHGFYVPAFRLKRDVIPGRYVKVWFSALKPGEYQIYCTQYCGTGHSDMWAEVVVHRPGGFERWLEQASNFLKTMSPAEGGRAPLPHPRVRAVPHRGRVQGGTGPTFKGLFGQPRCRSRAGGPWSRTRTTSGSRSWTRRPRSSAGFQPVMPTFKGRLKDDEITAIIEYLKTLK